MQLRIAVLHSELERQRKALGRERDLRQKERVQLQKKGKRVALQMYIHTHHTNMCLIILSTLISVQTSDNQRH